MNHKQFSERLNQELDEIGVPQRSEERIEIFAKLLKVPRFKAETILNGHAHLDKPTLEILANELEVDADWLLGKSNKKQN